MSLKSKCLCWIFSANNVSFETTARSCTLFRPRYIFTNLFCFHIICYISIFINTTPSVTSPLSKKWKVFKTPLQLVCKKTKRRINSKERSTNQQKFVYFAQCSFLPARCMLLLDIRTKSNSSGGKGALLLFSASSTSSSSNVFTQCAILQ